METEKQLLGALLDLTAEQQQAAAVALSLLGWGAIWWQRNEIARLNADIAQLQR